jgi:hypothetical protein
MARRKDKEHLMSSFPYTANQVAGAQLSQLARLLFDTSAQKWYVAALLEIFAGLIAAIFSAVKVPESLLLFISFLGVLLLAAAYALRLWFDYQYDIAETMRRQSVLSEGLNWPITEAQMREWRGRAGKGVRKQAQIIKRDPDYYASQDPPGSKRLAEMTLESAFWTRQQYQKLRLGIWTLVVFALLVAFFVSSLTLSSVLPRNTSEFVATVIYTFIPVVLSINLLGWAFRLGRLINSINEIENNLRNITNIDDEVQVLRLVSEYNCQHIAGFPIHTVLFNKWHDDIQALWDNQ